MTRINDYLWHLPHNIRADDPPEVNALISTFYDPLVQNLSEALAAHGYHVSSGDVMIRVDENLDNSHDMFYANVHFVKYLQSDIMARIHFWHMEWSLKLQESNVHGYVINLDRFKIVEDTRQIVPEWEGRLHTRLSSLPGNVMHFEDDDQRWSYTSQEEFYDQSNLFLDKFENLVLPWLED